MFDFLKKKISETFKGIEKKITTKILDEKSFEKVFWEIELNFLQANVSVDIISLLKNDLKEKLIGKRINKNFKKEINNALKDAINNILIEEDEKVFLKKIKNFSPCVIMIVGVNGSGKTTTISKLTNYFKKQKLKVVLSAGDTFRAASIEQLKYHGDKLSVPVIHSDYGHDSASIGYDAIQYAKKNKADVVLLDTAGRLHSNKNLMNELKKVKKVCKPNFTIFVADAITGSDVINQAKIFNEEIGIDYSILTKTDVDKNGGAILSVGYTINKPIIFLGIGQEYKDLAHFKKKIILEKLF